MPKRDKSGIVLSSLETFDALRSRLAYLHSFSIMFQSDEDGMPIDRIDEELAARYGGELEDSDIAELASNCAQATICTHVALLYAAIGCYNELCEINPELRLDELDKEIRVVRDSGLFSSMRELRNAVFHIRPNKRLDKLVEDVARRTLKNKLALAKLERLLYDATEGIFSSPESLFQEKEEVLMQGFRDAVAYYDKHLKDRS